MEDTNIQNEQNQPVTPSRTVQFLHASPREMTKPLILRQPSKQAFAAIWLWVKVTTHGTSDSQSHESQTQVSWKEVLCIVRNDGHVFSEEYQLGDTVWHGLQALQMTPKLPDKPHASHLWSLQGVMKYRQGLRPDPQHVFERIVDVVDRFISFDGSLAEQRTMCELVACYILSTWFLDSFDVIGYLWPYGPPGCGKTQLLTVIAELSAPFHN